MSTSSHIALVVFLLLVLLFALPFLTGMIDPLAYYLFVKEAFFTYILH